MKAPSILQRRPPPDTFFRNGPDQGAEHEAPPLWTFFQAFAGRIHGGDDCTQS